MTPRLLATDDAAALLEELRAIRALLERVVERDAKPAKPRPRKPREPNVSEEREAEIHRIVRQKTIRAGAVPR